METAYLLTLSIHNLVRWVVLILAVVAAVLAWKGWLKKEEWTEQNRKFGAFAGMAIDIQLLIGLILYFAFSPWTKALLAGDFKTAMTGEYRLFSVEHVFIMLLALVFAHLGSVLPRRAKDSAGKFRIAAIWFTLTVIFILAGIPWARPLLRLGA